MHCPRLKHFARFNPSGTISRCGHMVKPPQFNSLEEMESSQWLKHTIETFNKNEWPPECVRCKEIEIENGESIRLNAIKADKLEIDDDYLQIGGVLDNICNAACLICSPNNSTRIGSLYGKTFPIINNSEKFWSLPQDRIRHLDINGGEPSYSKNYKHLLQNLPPNLKTLRLNTNGNTVLTELVDVVNKGIKVTVTVSFDGVGPVHDLVRWPITWQDFYKNLMIYKTMPVELNLWTTVSVLNVDDLPNIIAFAKEHEIDHSYAYLKHPVELDVNNKNHISAQEYIQNQKNLRNIK